MRQRMLRVDGRQSGNGGMRSENGGVIGWNSETGGGIGASKIADGEMEGWSPEH